MGANNPVGVAWAPDGRMFIWQKNGVVRILQNGSLVQTPFLDFSAKINIWNDNGMTSFAFDPNHAVNGFIYLAYVVESGGNPNDSSPKIARVVRVTANPANPNVMLAGSETVIFDNVPDREGTHNTGCIRFGADGMMYVGIGDGAGPSFVDPDAFGAQDLTNIRGKIFRIRPDGTAPTDNPFYDGSQSLRSKVWCYGVRNPYRFSMHPINREPYIADVGWNDWEEISRGKRGGNLGWPYYEGNHLQPGYAAIGGPAPNPASVVFPLHEYPHSGGDLNQAGTCLVGGDFYTGTRYPTAYQGNYFYADYSGNWIHRMVLDGNGNFVSVHPFASGLSGPTCVEQGPDGYLYLVNLNSGQIRRIRYNGVIAAASAAPSFGYSPLQVAFSSAGSVDSNGGNLTYAWDFGDGATSTLANPTHTYTAATVRSFTARLTVRGSGNQTADATTIVTVGSVPPTPVISSPANGTGYLPGQIIAFQGSATDPEEGSLTPGALTWQVLLHHNDHVHVVYSSVGTGGSIQVANHGSIGTYSYEVVLTARDASGLEASTSVNLSVLNDAVLPSVPAGVVATPQSGASIALNWTASSDNGAVAGYRIERSQGSGSTSFALVTTVTGTTFTDTGLSPETVYNYRVSAMDVSGNVSGPSVVTSATTLTGTPPTSGLVAAFGFNEGVGATVGDASGNGNTGTINGATWTAGGKYGGALSFNGSNNLVLINDSASLDLTTGMTLEAWVRPAVAQNGWRTIIQKEVDTYLLHAGSNGALVPATGVTIAGAVPTIVSPSSIAVGQWTHLAGTYDGSRLRLYVNGVEVSNVAQSGALSVNNLPVRIGGNSPYGEFFNGLIDEVKIYNRALTAAEILADSNAPIAGGGGPANPTISDIGNQSTTANTPTGAIGFTVGDADTALTSLVLSGTSSNGTLVPNGNIVFGGSGANRTVTVTPAAGQTGSATITVNVSDGALSASDSFVLTVLTVNTPPTITTIGAQTVNEDVATGALSFTVGDGETAAGSLTVSGSSSNAALVPNPNIAFGGSGGNRTVTVTPLANQSGTTTITLTVSDGQASATSSFVLTVNAVNDVPTISVIGNQTTTTGVGVGPIAFTVADLETAAGSLSVSGASSNATLLPSGNIVFGGSAGNRTVTVTPAAGQTGTSTITVTVSDGSASANTSFVLTVNATTPVPAGLVAAYGFNEGVGATVGDASGLGNTGTINGATWTAGGKYGGALSFNGSNNLVLINDSASLDLTTGMTLEAWVRPAVAQSGWRTIIQKEVDTYLLHASSNGALVPATGVTIAGAVPTIVSPSSIVVGQWTHLAGTYDGSRLRLYVNGVEVSNVAQSGALSVNNLPVCIGGNSPYGEFFNGLIDEVRIYNRALTAAEILADSNAPIAGGGGAASPTISDIGNQSTNANTPTGAIGFTVGDADTALTSLVLSGTSSNGTLVPNGNIVFGGSGANRTVTVTPAAGQTGSATITVNVSDGALSASDSFVLTVLAVNTPPTITTIGAQTVNEDVATGALSFTVGDGETAAGSLTVSGSSSNAALVPNANIAFGGSGGSRTVTVTPLANQNGTTTITLTVSDGQASATSSFVLTVNAVNDGPTISDIGNQSTTANTPTGAIGFTVGDPDTALTSLVLSGTSSNGALVPNGNIVFGGSGANRTVTVTPAAGQTGSATITVNVSDGALSASDSFVLTVLAVNTPPTITTIGAQTVNEDVATGALSFTVGDGETAAGSLTVSGSSSNAALVPNANIAFGGSGGNRTVTVTPLANQNGTTTITLTVSDGQASATSSFVLTVNAVNDGPTISAIGNQTTTTGVGVGPIAFTVADVETAAGSLNVSGGASNATLVPSGNIVFGGSAGNRTVTVTPAAGQTGTSTITVTVSDGAASANTSFVLTVNATTPAPTGLVAAYGFNEGVGATVGDASGRGNTGTINGATWTAGGKYGGALSFNGANNLVLINDSVSLDLTTGMTLEAWVRPAAAQSGWRTIIQKEVDTYLLHASSNGALVPATGVTIAGAVPTIVSPSSIAVGQWTHLAGTYDGSRLRLYVNGAEVWNAAQSGALDVNNLPVRIGGNSPYGEYFNGLIDEVRIYNRALTAAEILADSNAPVSSSQAVQATSQQMSIAQAESSAVETLAAPSSSATPRMRVSKTSRNGVVVLQVDGAPGKSYTIEASDNLRDWSELRTVSDYKTGLSIIADLNGSSAHARFYRIRKD